MDAAAASHFVRSTLFPDLYQVTRIREILRSSQAAPDVDSDYLPSTISALSGEVARYDIEIAKLKAQLSVLEADRTALHTHYVDCRGLLSPVRRLPPETLGQIFALCAGSFMPDRDPLTGRLSLGGSLSSLAQLPLLRLAAVCSRWHAVVMGTPTLWNTIQLHSVLWSAPADPETMMGLLKAALERGRNTPLHVTVMVVEDALPYGPALELLASHSERWQSAQFGCVKGDLRHLSAVEGRLPRLEALELVGMPTPIDIFAVAPRLEDVRVAAPPGPIIEAAKLPLHQLRAFECSEFWGVGELLELGICPTISLMPRLAEGTEFTLQLAHPDRPWPEGFVPSTTLIPITSQISGFHIQVAEDFTPGSIGPTLTSIFNGLTLPAVEEVTLHSTEYPRVLLPWPHTQFLALAARSSFDAHLLSLNLYHCAVTEAELLECLRALPSLEQLSVSDHLGDPINHLLVTDSLFTALTRKPDEHLLCLAPRLRFFEFQSLLEFDDVVFLKFLISRLKAEFNAKHEEVPLHIAIWWLPGCHRDLDRHLVRSIGRLQSRGELRMAFDRTLDS
jgi:hypothetical protein